MRPERLRLDRLATPIGEIDVVTDAEGRLRVLEFHDEPQRLARALRLHHRDQAVETGMAPAAVREGLAAYFTGQLGALKTIPWTIGGTVFQREVWNALVDIPAGETTTYARLAARIGRPNAIRAMGAANGANPIAIVVPCHRVIGADGSLTGYGGGIARKRWLLAHEGVSS
ncbi:O-6-methylguanine DNA methyltransferase [Caulobacter sp. AP07]|uniref:methylated-DNA--[protein]-cysteine S-methyltransferase n=1 Tax=Caulobacter sp. AP07 TaxID=1144304 RepID=UPI0002721AEE|nr:methylated-DNA--[protein]-cysteine S-methyltransferase [Caulobacter sp. AP07]EJL34506.1 O-6-methylguanine DNA methyltransferase [Caulobacter sp. AP07]